MRIVKNILGIVMAIVCLFAPSVIQAQTNTSADPVNRVPVFVNDLQLVENPIQQGSSVKGSFTLSNGGTQAASNVYYAVELRNGAALYSEKLVGPLFLNTSEAQKVSFEYTLPAGIAGDLKVRIQAQLKTGEKLGWAELPIQVQGVNEYVKITKAALIVNDSSYVPTTGPTVHKDETASYKLTFTNPSSKQMTFVPTITAYNRTTANEPLSTTKAPAVTVDAKAQKEITIDLPLFNNKPGVYVAKIILADVNGSSRSEILLARYIVDGPIATVHTVTSDKQSVNKNDAITLKVTYTGMPFDITTGQIQAPVDATLKLTVFNESNQVVGSEEKSIQLSDSANDATFAFQSAVAASRLSAKAEVIKDGKVINEYTTSLSPAEMPNTILGQVPSMKTGVITFILGAVVAAIYFIVRHMRRKNMPIAPMVAIVLAAGLLTTQIIGNAVFAFNGNNNDPANVTFVSSANTPFFKKSPCTNCGSFDIFLNTPNTRLQVGQTFTLSGSWSFYACENTPPKPKITVTMPGGTAQQFNINDSLLVEHAGQADSTFSISSSNFKFNAAGTYLVHLKFQTDIYDNATDTTRPQILEGDLQITVDAPTVTTDTNLEVVKVGADGAIIGAGSSQVGPSTWTVNLFKEPMSTYGYTPQNTSTNNPAKFNAIDPTPTRELQAVIRSGDGTYSTGGYNVQYGVCTGVNCVPTSYTPIACDLGSWTCTSKITGFTLTQGQTKRVFFKYIPKMNTKVIVYRVDANNNILSSVSYPVGVSSMFIVAQNTANNNEGGEVTANPASFANIRPANGASPTLGIQAVSINNANLSSAGIDPSGFAMALATCEYNSTTATDCTLGAYQNPVMNTTGATTSHYDEYNPGYFSCDGRSGYINRTCEYKFYIADNMTRKVYFKYGTVVTPPPTLGASCSSNPSSIVAGQSTTWSASGVNGGIAPYTYAWSGTTDTGSWSIPASSSATSVTRSYPTAGSYSATLQVTSSDGQTYTAYCPNLTVTTSTPPPAATVSCRPTNPANGNTIYQAPSGQPVRWVADASNGATSGFVWGGSVSGSSKEVTVVYTTTGLKTANVSYNGGTAVNCDVTNFRVSTQPGYKEF